MDEGEWRDVYPSVYTERWKDPSEENQYYSSSCNFFLKKNNIHLFRTKRRRGRIASFFSPLFLHMGSLSVYIPEYIYIRHHRAMIRVSYF